MTDEQLLRLMIKNFRLAIEHAALRELWLSAKRSAGYSSALECARIAGEYFRSGLDGSSLEEEIILELMRREKENEK